MKRILSIAALIALIGLASPLALAQKPGKDKNQGDEQTTPSGKPRTVRPAPRPQPQPEPRRLPQNPGAKSGGGQPSGLPGAQGGQPSGLPGKSTGGQGGQTPKAFDPSGRRFDPPSTGNPNTGKGAVGPTLPGNKSAGTPGNLGGAPLKGSSGDPSKLGGRDPRSLGQPGSTGQPGPTIDPSNRKLTAPSRGDLVPRSRFPDTNAGKSGNAGGVGPIGGGKAGNPAISGNPNNPAGARGLGKIGDPNPARDAGKLTPPSVGNAGNKAGGADLGQRNFKPAPINPSGKPRGNDGQAAKTGVLPEGAGGVAGASIGQPSNPNPVPIPHPNTNQRKLGKPSGRGGTSTDAPATGGAKLDGAGIAPRTPVKGVSPATSSQNVAKVGAAPTRFQKIKPADGDGDSPFSKSKQKVVPVRPVKPVAPPKPVAPEGGKHYKHGDYHHEYAHHHHHRSSFAFGLGFSDGSTSLAFGYSSGGWGSGYAFGAGYGYGYGYGGYAPYYHPYWHCPVWYQPVVYAPYYAVAAPIYYAPAYPVVVDPWAYNSSSFAFGFSSFGGSALSSFSFAYSTSNWGVGIGYYSAPAYSIYTPVYDPYFRPVWIPGYYQIVSERAWVPGRYTENVSTPVVENVVDPLGNTYDAVTEAGSVDYVWTEGYWTLEDRRIWVPGRFEYVAVF